MIINKAAISLWKIAFDCRMHLLGYMQTNDVTSFLCYPCADVMRETH